jgi:hypothetical protein
MHGVALRFFEKHPGERKNRIGDMTRFDLRCDIFKRARLRQETNFQRQGRRRRRGRLRGRRSRSRIAWATFLITRPTLFTPIVASRFARAIVSARATVLATDVSRFAFETTIVRFGFFKPGREQLQVKQLWRDRRRRHLSL